MLFIFMRGPKVCISGNIALNCNQLPSLISWIMIDAQDHKYLEISAWFQLRMGLYSFLAPTPPPSFSFLLQGVQVRRRNHDIEVSDCWFKLLYDHDYRNFSTIVKKVLSFIHNVSGCYITWKILWWRNKRETYLRQEQ